MSGTTDTRSARSPRKLRIAIRVAATATADRADVPLLEKPTDVEAVDVVVCDLQGSASVAMIHAIHYADLVLIPVQPSNDDLKSAHSTARHVAQAGKSARREIPYRIVISRASTGFRPEVEKVVEAALENAGMPRLRTPVFERTAFKRASFSRVAPIFEEPEGGAAVNIKTVYAEVKQTLAETVAKARELV